MNKTKYHTFELSQKSKGAIDMRYGTLSFVHEVVSSKGNHMGVSVFHHYNSKVAQQDPNPSYGRGWGITLSPAYDPTNLGDFYTNKVEVTKYADGRFDKIIDRNNTSKYIEFVYETVNNSTRLQRIIDSEGRIIFIGYIGTNNMPCLISFLNGESLDLLWGDTSYLYVKIKENNKAGVAITWQDNKITNIKNTINFSEIKYNQCIGVSPSLDGYGETNFSYITDQTNKTDESNNEIIYNFYTKPANPTELQELQDGLIREELKINNISKSIITYERSFDGSGKKQEVITYNPNQNNEAIITDIYWDETKLYKEIAEGYFNKITEGIVDQQYYKNIEITFAYYGEKVGSKTTIVKIKTNKNSIENISENKYELIYYYDLNYKLIKILSKTNENDDIVQEKIIDPQNENLEIWDTFYNDPISIYDRICSKQLYDVNKRLLTTYDERGFGTDLDYSGSTCLVNKITDPDNHETNISYCNNSYDIKSTSSNIASNTNEFSYTQQFLTRLESTKEKYDFEYYGKTENFLYKQNIKVNEQPYVSHITQKDGLNETLISEYISGDKYESLSNTDNQMIVTYTPNGGSEQDILTNNYNEEGNRLLSSKDYLANTNTYFNYDINNNVISTENEQIKTTISTDNEGELTNTKYFIKDFDLIHNYGYSYVKDAYGRKTSQIISLPNNQNATCTYDKLKRIQSINVGPINKTFTFKNGQANQLGGNYTTNFVDEINFGLSLNFNYEYDSNGNISIVKKNSVEIARYYYDSINQLIREDNALLNETYSYTYDNSGNILSKNIYAYTTLASLSGLTPIDTKTYTFVANRDILQSFDGQNCVYNNLGNPTTYRGKTLEWSHIRHLRKFDNMRFDYNANGLRTIKKDEKKYSKYYYADGLLLAEQQNIISSFVGEDLFSGEDIFCQGNLGAENINQSSRLIEYYYGVDGIAGFKVDGNVYYYRKNLQGDIINILNSSGDIISEYVYDAWGNHKIYAIENEQMIDITNNLSYNNIAHINPFRYRGYYYDVETGLYYLKSRYYDPETGRFINMDDINKLNPKHLCGLNLYCYCGNQPINRIDNGGQDWTDIIRGSGEIADKFISFYENWQIFYLIENLQYGKDILKQFNISKFSATLRGLRKSPIGGIGSIIGYGLILFDAGLNLFNNIEAGIPAFNIVANFIADVGKGVTIMYTTIAVGALIGSLIPIPVLGAVIGAFAGILAGEIMETLLNSIGIGTTKNISSISDGFSGGGFGGGGGGRW